MSCKNLITSSMFRRGAVATLLLTAPLAYADEAVSEEEAAPRLAPGLQLSLKLESGLAVALTDPQADQTELGFRQTLKVLFGLNRYLAIGPSAAFTTLPASAGMTGSGTAWSFGGTARLERPRDAPGGRFNAMSPWIDADLAFVRTGELNRPGFAAATGVAVPIDDDRKFWIGPFARYSQILQDNRSGIDGRDAKILSFGLSLEVGPGLAHKRSHMIAEAPLAPVLVAEVVPSDCDGDTVTDDKDNCPDVAGLVENGGCPAYPGVVIKPGKLEVNERIAFEWNSANLDASSFPVLDQVVKALEDNRGFNVQVDRHASSDGDFDYNQTLSERRAEAVLDYLVSHGIGKSRLISKGFGSTVPTETNTTVAGRESNRRVEFVVSFIIVKQGS